MKHLPQSFGARCSSKAACTVRGREEPLRSASWRPPSLNSWIALRTTWSLQPRDRAIWRAFFPSALAERIWQRRRTKASGERGPALIVSRSASLKRRTKIGRFIP